MYQYEMYILGEYGKPKAKNYLEVDNVTPLHAAVISNQIQEVKYEIKCLKEQNKSLDFQINSGDTSLLFACKQFIDTNIAKLLIEEEADVNICDDMGVTPLHAACWYGKQDVAEVLLKAGANVNAQDFSKDLYPHSRPHNTPLHYALKRINSNLTNLLLDAGADANIENFNRKIPLCLALRNEYKLSNEHTCESDYLDKSTLERLVSLMPNLNKSFPFWPLLTGAIYDNDPELISILIKYGVDVNFYTTNIPIGLAVEMNRIEIFKILWKVVNIINCNEDENFLYSLLRWSLEINNPDYIECFYQVMETSGVILHPERRYFDYLLNSLKIEDGNFLQVDLCRIIKILLEKGALFVDEHFEILIYLCRRYHRYNHADREINLLNILIESNVNISPYTIYFSIVNHPELTLKLLQYCIMCDPIDIFKHFLICKRKIDVSLLNLIKNVLKLCSPYRGLRFKRFTHIDKLRTKNPDVRTLSSELRRRPPNKLKFPWFECVIDSKIDNELCEEVLDLLYGSSVPLPTLLELSRNKIRQQLRLSCKDTKSYLQNLKSLELLSDYTDIIQCKVTVLQMHI